MMKLESSGGNFGINGPHLSGQTAGPPTQPTVSTYSLARAIEEMGAAMVFSRDAEIYRESSPATYLAFCAEAITDAKVLVIERKAVVALAARETVNG